VGEDAEVAEPGHRGDAVAFEREDSRPIFFRSRLPALGIALLTGSAGVTGGDDAVLVGEDDGLYPAAQIELHEDAAHVALDGRLGHDESPCDLGVGYEGAGNPVGC
jgi:hypothetical protein